MQLELLSCREKIIDMLFLIFFFRISFKRQILGLGTRTNSETRAKDMPYVTHARAREF